MGEPWIPETETVNPPTVAVVIGLHGVGETAPEEEERIDLSAGITWFGDILNIEGPLVEIGSRSVLEIPRSVSGISQRGRVYARPDPAGVADDGEIVASGARPNNVSGTDFTHNDA